MANVLGNVRHDLNSGKQLLVLYEIFTVLRFPENAVPRLVFDIDQKQRSGRCS